MLYVDHINLFLLHIQRLTMSRQHALPIGELKTMFPVQSEPSDACDVGKDSQYIRFVDDNPRISDTSNTNT